jgi:hypothetical protein
MAQSPFLLSLSATTSPLRSHDRVPMAEKEEYGLPQRHPRPKGRYDTLSLFSKLHCLKKLNDSRRLWVGFAPFE